MSTYPDIPVCGHLAPLQLALDKVEGHSNKSLCQRNFFTVARKQGMVGRL